MPSALLDLVLPRRCLGCARPARGLCPSCAFPQLRQRMLAEVGVVHAAGSYRGPLGAGVLHFKDRRRRDLLAPLGAALGAAVDATMSADSRPIVLVPVPSTARAAAQRGGDHMRRLASVAAQVRGVPVFCALAACGGRADSAHLDAALRRATIGGSFRCVRPPPAGMSAILVDDVLTTGATLQEAARTLRAAGWSLCGAAVVTITPRARRSAR